jgi:hypothetical protein
VRQVIIHIFKQKTRAYIARGTKNQQKFAFSVSINYNKTLFTLLCRCHMTDTQNKKTPYTVLENNKGTVAKTQPKAVAKPSAKKALPQETPSVQNTQASVPDGQSVRDVILKVIIDIIARLTGQPSPTGGKLPTLSKQSIQAKTDQAKQQVWSKLTGWFAAVGNKLETAAQTAVQSAGSVVQKAKDTASDTAHQAVNMAKEQTQWAVDAAKNIGQSAVNVAKDSVSDVVDTAKNVANEAKDVASNAVDSAKNMAHDAKDAAGNAVDTAKATVRKKDPLL